MSFYTLSKIRSRRASQVALVRPRLSGAGRPVLQRHRAGVDAAMIMQRAQKEVEQAEQDAIKSTPEMEKLLKASPGVVAARRRLEELKERLGM